MCVIWHITERSASDGWSPGRNAVYVILFFLLLCMHPGFSFLFVRFSCISYIYSCIYIPCILAIHEFRKVYDVL